MKTIQIPTTSNPFIVNINNAAYQYRAGETAEVPGEVAEAIEDALEMEPRAKRYLSMYEQYVEGSITHLKEEDICNVGVIAPYAFYKYDNLQSAAIPKGVTSIGASAFRYCAKLTRVEIPENVTSIGDKAFANCITLSRVTLRMPTPPILQVETFAEVPTTCVFEVHSDAMEAYKTAQYWSAFANQIVAIEE